MAKNDTNQELMQEAFHTYQTYLTCMKIDIGGVSNLPLLKWPDVAQSALAYAEASDTEKPAARAIFRQDLFIAVAGPIEAMHKSTKEHIKKHIGKDPKTIPYSTEERWKFPIQYKNRLIDDINNMFKTLATMTGVEYPELRKRDDGSRS
jgi:hypothetical protein